MSAVYGESNVKTTVPVQNRMQEAKRDQSASTVNVNGLRMEVKDIDIDILSDYSSLHKMYYSVEDVPPFHLSFLFGMQVYIFVIRFFTYVQSFYIPLVPCQYRAKLSHRRLLVINCTKGISMVINGQPIFLTTWRVGMLSNAPNDVT